MKSLIVTREHELFLDANAPDPVMGEYDALVQNECCVICNGTDVEILQGRLAEIKRYPAMLGHESAGRVIRLGNKVRHYRLGDLVTRSIVRANDQYGCGWGGFSEYGVVTDYEAMKEDGRADASQYTIGLMQRVFPAGITAEQAAISITLKEVYAAFGRIGVKAGERILICGDGPVALCMLAVSPLYGVKEVYLLGQNAMTLAIAKANGAAGAFDRFSPQDREALEAMGKVNHYIDTIGTQETVTQGLSRLLPDGMITVYGLHSGSEVVLPLAGMRNFGVRFMQFPIHQKEGEAHPPVVKAILEGALKPESLISHRFPLEKYQDAFELIRQHQALKIVLTMDGKA